MKNILLLASIYPVYKEGYVGTKICHYFAKEWVKMGYNVKVLFFWSSFPKPYYWITKPFVSSLRAKTSFAFPTFNFTETEVYTLDGVEVILLPVKKILPHAAPSETYLYKLLKEGVDILNKKGCRRSDILFYLILSKNLFTQRVATDHHSWNVERPLEDITLCRLCHGTVTM